MVMLETSYGFVSSRYIIRIQKAAEDQWWVYYQSGSDVSGATAEEKAVREFMGSLVSSARPEPSVATLEPLLQSH